MNISNKDIILSKLGHTWLIDIDGTLLLHNGYLENKDTILPGVKNFFNKIPKNDYIILLTSRKEKYRNETETILQKNQLRFNKIIFDLPEGERILINDIKPRGLKTALSVNIKRNLGIFNNIIISCQM